MYLTVDEFKGRRAAVRGSARIAVDPLGLRNPDVPSEVSVRTGGSRGAGSSVPINLAFARDGAVNMSLALEARGGTQWLHAIWEVPGGGALVHLLECSALGARPVRWFSQVDPAAP
ncbi:MAG: hypothetical protein H0V51_16320, partial [Chloroflexi bacterium]|nr:hypothetical protein [Chloroflexota bacterium]